MNLKDLWIGDKLTIEGHEGVGTFVGLNKDGTAIVKINNKIIAVHEAVLCLFVPQEDELILTFENEEKIKSAKSKPFVPKSNWELDLHIEKLNPDLVRADAATILEFQLASCQKYIEDAISRKASKVTIIHGKGEGKLKDYVHSLLSGYSAVKWKILMNKDGATEVWFG
jgi:dsDNA-specific endonuclease/ATPase MutS2